MKTFRVFVEIINRISQECVERFTVEIDRTSNGYLAVLADANFRLKNTGADLLAFVDCEYVLGLVSPPEGCYVVTGKAA